MEIQNSLRFARLSTVPQPNRKNPVSGNLASVLTPGQQAELAAQERSLREHPPLSNPNDTWGYFSPSMQMDIDYAEWKAQQPESQQPESQLPDEGGGLTEENLNYLRERYSGSLSWNEKLGVLEDLYKMGVLDKEQCEDAVDGRPVTITLSLDDPSWGLTYSKYDPNEPSQWAKDWERIYLHSPAAGFQQLEDILNWAKTQTQNGLPAQENGTGSISE